DALYAEAIASRSAHRLRTYLVRNPRKYLAGYLAVRSLVAAWRSTLGEPLSGNQAFRILLHMTRFSDFEAIPDLGLPLKEFQQAAITKHLEWVQTMTAASAEDLRKILGPYESGSKDKLAFRWVKGKLEEAAHDAATDERGRHKLEALLEQCLSSLVGTRAPLDRVKGASQTCYAVLAAAAKSLTPKHRQPQVF